VVHYRRANRQYLAMPRRRIWQFVDSGEKLYVAFPMNDGYPHVSPVWFCVLNRRIYIRTQDYKVKARLANSGKACCALDDGTRYRELRGVIIWGRCRVVAEQGLMDRIERTMRMKYRKQQWTSSEMPARWVRERKAEKRAYIEIIPLRVSSWDNSRIR
jgi:hypothetical protein